MSFETSCPEGVLKLQLAEGNKPPRPDQHELVCQWPWFGLEEELLGARIINNTLPEKFNFRPRGLLLFGDSATGKTTSMWSVIQETFWEWDSGCSVPDVFPWRAAELGRTITDAARGGEGELEIFVRQLQRCGLLLIDDLDKARFSPTVQSQLFDVLEYRELHSLPVVITTNCTGPELAGKFDKSIGAPIIKRLCRMCYTVDFDDQHFNLAGELAAIQKDTRERFGQQLGLCLRRLALRQKAAQKALEERTATPPPSAEQRRHNVFAAMRANLRTNITNE